MARAIWTGALSFGLVNVPVALYSATEDRSIRFNQFEEGTGDRVRSKRVNERTGDEVSYDRIVKGYDLGGGDYVLITPDELAAVAPGRSRTIQVTDFVDLSDVDPVFFDRPYYVGPDKKQNTRAYGLLAQVMQDTGKAAVGQFVMRDKQYLVAIRPGPDGVLTLETLRWADEVRTPAEVLEAAPESGEFDDREKEMAALLVETMTTDWDPERYEDAYRGRVEDLIERKRGGEIIATGGPEEPPAPVVDLLDALRASVKAVRGDDQADEGAKASPARRKAPAKAPKAPAKKPRSAPAVVASASDSKAALLKRAAALGVRGRTSMSREELAQAVQAAERPRTRAKKVS
jgi:DNA end-binding protein Ku